jgi:hypothetical protein
MELEPTDYERLVRKRKWESARQILQERLGALGLVVERDYLFRDEDWPAGVDRIGVELRDENLITVDFLLGCRLVLLELEEGRWGAIVAVLDSTRINGVRLIVEISGGEFSFLRPSDATKRLIFEAYDKLGVGHLVRPRRKLD